MIESNRRTSPASRRRKANPIRAYAATPPKAALKADPVGTPNTTEVAAYGSEIYTMDAFRQWNPDELIQSKGAGVYAKMMLDDQVKATNRFKRAAVASRKWFFDKDPEKAEHEEIAAIFEAIVDGIQGSFQGALIGILSDTVNGYSLSEKVWKPILIDGKVYWGIKAIKVRPYDTFDFKIDIHGNITGLQQRVQGKTIACDIRKFIHSVHQSDIDEIYGESDLRACYRDWWSKDVIIKFRNIFLERTASGFLVAKVGPGLSNTQKTELKTALQNVSASTAMIVPQGIELDHISPEDTRAYDEAIKACNIAIAKSQLMPNLLGLSDQGDVGSYSQSQTQFEAFLWVLDEIAMRLEETLNEQLFKQLAAWNFGTDDFPRFTFEPISDAQKGALMQLWGDLISKGAVKRTLEDENYVRQLLGFPEVEEEEEIAEPMPIASPVEEPTPMDGDGAEESTDGKDVADPEESQQVDNIDCGCGEKHYAANAWSKRVDFAEIERFQDEQTEDYAAEFNDIATKIEQSMIDAAIRMWGSKSGNFVDPLKVEGLEMPKSLKGKLRKASRSALESTFKRGVAVARGELPKAMATKVIRSGLDKLGADRYLAAQTFRITGDYSDAVVKAVQTELVNGIKFDRTIAQVTQRIQELAIFAPSHAETIARTSISDAYNQARLQAFNDPDLDGFVTGYEYSAILDGATTEVCTCLDGVQAKDFGDRTPPNHFNCRSLLIPITEIDDAPEWADEARITRCSPMVGFGG